MSDQLVFIYTQGFRFALVGDPSDVFQQLSYCNEVVGQAGPPPRRRFRRGVPTVPLVAGRVLRVGPGFAISYQQSADDPDPKPAVLRPIHRPGSLAPARAPGDLSAGSSASADPVGLPEVHTVTVDGRHDGLYVFTEAQDRDRFLEAVQETGGQGSTSSEPVNDPGMTDCLIASEFEV